MERLSQQLDWLAREYGHVPALISERHYLSFIQLQHAFDKTCAFLLKHHQAGQPSVVALIFDNPLLHVITSLACLRCGLTQFSIDSKEKTATINDLIGANGIDWLLTDNRQIQAIGAHATLFDFDILYSVDSISQFPECNMDRKAVLVTGSGSTGKPKQVAFTFRQYQQTLLERSDPFDIQAKERFLSMVPVHFHAGKTRNLTYLLKGASCVFITQANIPTPVILDRLMIEHVYCVDLHLGQLLQQTQNADTRSAVRFPYLKSLIATGSPVSKERILKIQQNLTRRLFVLYGANEVFHVALARPEDLERFPDTIGKIIPEAELRILTQDKQNTPLNEVGHAHIRTPGMAEGYENNPRATEDNFHQGWFMPKDLLRQNEEGYLFFEGRSDDLIIFDGMNIYPVEIESLLNALPEVEESAAFPLHVPGRGDVPVAVLALVASHGDKDETFFLEHLRKHMGKRSPQRIVIMEALPRNPRGKILKYQLREALEKQLGLNT